MNGVVVSTCPLYAYKHYLDTILNYGTDAQNTQLSLGGFFKDSNSDNQSRTLTATVRMSFYFEITRMDGCRQLRHISRN